MLPIGTRFELNIQRYITPREGVCYDNKGHAVRSSCCLIDKLAFRYSLRSLLLQILIVNIYAQSFQNLWNFLEILKILWKFLEIMNISVHDEGELGPPWKVQTLKISECALKGCIKHDKLSFILVDCLIIRWNFSSMIGLKQSYIFNI